MNQQVIKTETTDTNDELLPGVPNHIKVKLFELVANLDKVESVVNKIESKSLKEQSNMTPLEIAKLNWISMYAINSLFFVYLKNSGTTLKEHPLMTELGRVRSYMQRIKDIEEAEKIKNTQRIDKDSSARIIKRSLWMNASKKKQTDDQDDDDNAKSIKRINLNN